MSARGLRHLFLGVALGGAAAFALPAFADEPAPVHAELAAAGPGEDA